MYPIRPYLLNIKDVKIKRPFSMPHVNRQNQIGLILKKEEIKIEDIEKYAIDPMSFGKNQYLCKKHMVIFVERYK